MPLGYAPRAIDVIAYYGAERKDIAQVLFKYGIERRVIMTNNPGVLGGSKGQLGFSSPEQILEMAKKGLDNSPMPRHYPAFHGTIGKFGGLIGRALKGADVVIDIDVKDNYKEAFKDGKRVINFLDFHNIPYRIKFSGGTGPHIIIPFEAFPEHLCGDDFSRIHHMLFKLIVSGSGARNVDLSFKSFNHFYRLPYSLNEYTGLVSVPIRREQYDDFTPSMAEIKNIEVDESWFNQLEESSKQSLEEFILSNKRGWDE